TPDLTTLGKSLGGGLPCAAFGGRADIMDQLAPLGPVYQAGTLSGNPLAMAAGIATLGYLLEHRAEVYPLLESLSRALVEGVAAEAARAGVALTANRVGSMFTWFFNDDADFNSAARSDMAAFGRFHRAMLEQGVWLPCSQFEGAFLSAAHSMEDVRETIDAAGAALRGIAKGK
ncbi:MAG: aminotransferase class III-fold pyridoxal phosphate-dependent enzyme, partial [Acidobacteriaceae bacterium]